MGTCTQPWDYLIVTASNDDQAAAYDAQLRVRRELELFDGVGKTLVVADPAGKRVGSGGSTVQCLMTVLNHEQSTRAVPISNPAEWESALRKLRILIVHGGGDSKRLPVYGPCGKIFMPVPGDSDSPLPTTLFDRLLPTYLALPPSGDDCGQTVMTAGDALLLFDPERVKFEPVGITGLGCYATPEQAGKHGVFCRGSDGTVRQFLQKPSPDVQREKGAVDRYGRSILDIGVMSFDAATAVALLELCGAAPDRAGRLCWTGELGESVPTHGLDFFREICCALGSEATTAHYIESARASGTTWTDTALGRMYDALSAVPFSVHVVPRCAFLHFGTVGQIISSGLDLVRQSRGTTRMIECLDITNDISNGGRLDGARAWVEGCRIRSHVRVGAGSVLVGADVTEPLSVPPDACLDVLCGRNRCGEQVWFMRCYRGSDDFKGLAHEGATLWGLSINDLPAMAAAEPGDIWDTDIPADGRAVWNARVFPAESDPSGYRRWLWMLEPDRATSQQWKAWRSADRYSFEEIARLADHDAFHERRVRIRAFEIIESLPRLFRPESALSARELAFALVHIDDDGSCLSTVFEEMHRCHAGETGEPELDALGFSRVVHTVGSAIEMVAADRPEWFETAFHKLDTALAPSVRASLDAIGLTPGTIQDVGDWVHRAKAFAFEHISKTITSAGDRLEQLPASALRKDEIVWGRAPARLELAGGWTDTPPYTLERGGSLLNAAVNLNGQPPIQAYARVIDTPVIRLASIDFGERLEIDELDALLDYRHATSGFSLPKAALALSGLSPDTAPWPEGFTLREMLETFGGGIELTTLAAIPSGSGLGTSSIMGAVVLAVVQRVIGRSLTQRELFYGVLQLEQALTTGGGWQDQVGGVVGGVKMTTTERGLVPDPRIHFVPADVLDPEANGGCTLLYYTGITRLAKNILQNVVSRYLDRERAAMATFERIHAFPAIMADIMSRKDTAAFGHTLAEAWELQKEITAGSSTNPQIEALLARVEPYVYGARILGAGDGGFLLLVCKSPEDAAAVRDTLETDPPNDSARFFDFGVNTEGLVVTVC